MTLKELKQLQSKLAKIEIGIEDLEKQKSEIEAEFGKQEVYEDADKMHELQQSLESKNQKLDNLNLDWEEVGLKIEAIENN